MLLAQQVFWAMSLGLSKLSILTLYSKVFSVDHFILLSLVTGVVIILWCVHNPYSDIDAFFISHPFPSSVAWGGGNSHLQVKDKNKPVYSPNEQTQTTTTLTKTRPLMPPVTHTGCWSSSWARSSSASP